MPRLAMLVPVTLALAAYPLLVWLGLAHFGAPALMGLLLILLGLRTLIAGRGRNRTLAVLAGILLAGCGVIAILTGTGSDRLLRWYPVLASLVATGVFTLSLFTGRPAIERIARLRQPDLPPEGVQYTRRLTVAWAALTFANALIAAWTAAFATIDTWALYNGVLSYLLLGGFFCLEWLYRQRRFREA